ncbi:MAG: hypothetical protein ACLP8A_01175 [Methylovirgula sp.]
MTEAENLVLEHLRHMRGQLDRIESRLDDMTIRLGHVERSSAEHAVQLAEINAKLDRLDGRVSRIEKRLDLVES